MHDLDRKSVFVICPVRDATDKEKEYILDYVKQLERQGYDVHYPARDTNQEGDPIGLRILRDNCAAIRRASEVHVFWNGKSSGSHFDIGASFILQKPFVLFNRDQVQRTKGKSFTNVLLELDKRRKKTPRLGKAHHLIHYSPKPGICGHSVTAHVSNEFIEFAKRQKIGRRKYERLGLEMIRECGWPDFKYSDIQHAPRICGWVDRTGLLFYVNVPGNAAGVALEKGSNGWVYHPHNMDRQNQAAVVLGLMTNYLTEIEARIPRK